jgi:hypothetical protein
MTQTYFESAIGSGSKHLRLRAHDVSVNLEGFAVTSDRKIRVFAGLQQTTIISQSMVRETKRLS